ncbi:MAG: class I SAM-dependent DNA methyltransferase [Chloroflexi bacterium]|nr:class I SAM-dependent DNA methyltransferase [Chloroflexota bacterium]MCI0580640.1 class I SAM-dependent DNA methyltransferase [Chloroflexota bacterium]MCI0644401.1 class I SAM-dependent DNA methyltransferase [Chloroflexota bacterium]MCI0730337.1 class I SAM-dependent DNA methyltransferase [Chloroflexota bacterium]
MPAALTAKEFVGRWRRVQLKETAAAHSHFNDVCALVGHAPPHVADPAGTFFTFEARTEKPGGERGRADVWYKGRFIWEYKGRHADLDKAYQQLLLYRESLGNPPLLITCDLQRIIIHTNFTNTVKQVHEITPERLLAGDGLALLRRVFEDPESFRPARTQEQVTRATADTFVEVVNTLQKWGDAQGNPHDPEALAHFVIRLLFCLFAEDMGLLPNSVFTLLVEKQGHHFYRFVDSLRALFQAMRNGGPFGVEHIPHFDGTLFDDNFVPELPSDIVDKLLKAGRQDWSAVDPSIFGTLFERVIDEAKRAQLGAHYTSKDDIMLIVEPVLMKPLRDEWQGVKNQARRLLAGVPAGQRPVASTQGAEAQRLLASFAGRLGRVRVLDPANGSGNFLYVALRQLLDLQKEVITFAGAAGLEAIPLSVSPAQLYGIEINPYAHELAQITVWIGYLQWRKENGLADFGEPILTPLGNIERKDAILAYDAAGSPVKPEWPEVDVIIGNPPFLGSQRLRRELGNAYTEMLFKLYGQRVPGAADLVAYWFERARERIDQGYAKRAGLLATQAIRAGASRQVLDSIKNTGDIFWAQSDRAWILEGANVRVSMIGFDDGSEKIRQLDGEMVRNINADLTSKTDVTIANPLPENANLCFRCDEKGGPFDIDAPLARKMHEASNPSGRNNADVVRPFINALDITHRPRNMWIIDFGAQTALKEAELYEMPFEYVKQVVKPVREESRDNRQREYWWLHRRPAPDMRAAVANLSRFIGTPRVAKYRLFVFMTSSSLPDSRIAAIAREDDYFFGVLHSKVHEVWSLTTSSRHGVGNDPTYNITTCFETFPFPWPPGQEPAEEEDARVLAIAEAARQLDGFRRSWLYPLEAEVGVTIPERTVRQRTLTNLYNALALYRETYQGRQRDHGRWRKEVGGIITLEQIEELDYIHQGLDTAVLAAYGWPRTLTEEQLLERLLALNLERAGGMK